MGMRQGYMLENNYGSGYRKAPGFLGIGAQPQLDHRYLNEDVGWGLVFMSRLARQVGIETPTLLPMTFTLTSSPDSLFSASRKASALPCTSDLIMIGTVDSSPSFIWLNMSSSFDACC